jgi:hypothetical protein
MWRAMGRASKRFARKAGGIGDCIQVLVKQGGMYCRVHNVPLEWSEILGSLTHNNRWIVQNRGPIHTMAEGREVVDLY